jgi:hypothetical protein
MLPRQAVVRSAVSGALLTVAAFVIYWVNVGRGETHARGVALATLIIGYQILVLVERASSSDKPSALVPRSLRFWLVWGASALSLPVLMYVPTTAALMNVAPLGLTSWLTALGAGILAVGWRVIAAARSARG